MENVAEATGYDQDSNTWLAKVGLSGYRAVSDDPLLPDSLPRLVWGFTLLEGDKSRLRRRWSRQTPLRLCTWSGKMVVVRLLAFSTEGKGHGVLEFLLDVV